MNIAIAGMNHQGFHSEISDVEIRHMYLHPEDLSGSPYYNYTHKQIENLYMKRVYLNLTEEEREQDKQIKEK